MQNSLIDFSDDDLQKGFRLHRLEVYNWGTFNQKVWKVEPCGFNSLLTGDIGSGKSTLVDAIVTLLVPPNKIIYNKAAGAGSKERTIGSYVMGEYKNQRSEFSNNSSPVYLRNDNEYSVLLARFYNKGFESGYTLAQVFWIRKGIAKKFFVISKQDLSIKEHFKINNDERDVFSLKKRLKTLDQTEVYDYFKDYSSKFRSHFGIKSEKVMELFYQTVSMKSVGKLTEFMRNHMLEKLDVKDEIEGIKNNYENLTKSHEAVQKAKRQLEQLTPLDEAIDAYQIIVEKNIELKKSIDFLPVFFADKKAIILEKEIQSHISTKERTEHDITKITLDLETLRDQEKDVIISINQNEEGQRINQLDSEIAALEKVKITKHNQNQKYSNLCVELGFFKDPDENQFQQTLNQADELKKLTETDLKDLVTQRDSVIEAYRKLRDLYEIDKNELDSLTRRKTKIPEKNIQIRKLILTHLDLKDSELPFVGELLQIKPEEKRWEGAIERVLHSFGLSILVAERYYKEVSSFVDKTNLKGRIVYFKIPENIVIGKRKEPEINSLIQKIDIKADSEFYGWISNELYGRFNYICCESIEQFRREVKAITKNGQIKGGQGRHEKDDGKNLHDQRYYVLGWNNQEKIKIIEEEIVSLEKQIKQNQDKQKAIDRNKNTLEYRKTNLHDFLQFQDHHGINWKQIAEEIEKCQHEIEELKKSSDLLKTLKTKLESIQNQIEISDKEKSELKTKVGEINSKISVYKEDFDQCKQLLSEFSLDKESNQVLIINSVLSDDKYDIKTIGHRQENVKKTLTKTFDDNANRERKIGFRLISKMQKFKQEYPEETVEMVATIEAIPEYRKFYEKIKTEDLPRYEERFKKLLHEGTINDIALFKSRLDSNAKQIEKNIKAINDSLKTIEYNSGTYIELLSEKIQDIDINTFKIQLRDCLQGSFGEINPYSENKFNQVKIILDRFNSGNSVDINWTNKVTDVRNWYSFSAVEKYLSDNSEKEFYSDSSGKSGGQKEKLAYTILASALAYQFGPAGDNPKSKSFRFVMIDEAFGRGSDESARYGLDLFKTLDLQLLIITPMQKIHIIENYINCVHLISNETGSNSMSRDISIQEYHKTRLNQSNINVGE
ncbi:ATP-binding protein [Methanogenium cariaci]